MCYACLMSSAQSDVLPPGVDGRATVRQARSSAAGSLLKVLRPGRYFNALAIEVVRDRNHFFETFEQLESRFQSILKRRRYTTTYLN